MHELHDPQYVGHENPLPYFVCSTCISYVMMMMASMFLIVSAMPKCRSSTFPFDSTSILI